MYLAVSVVVVVSFLFVGLTLHRAIANSLAAIDRNQNRTELDERDLLLLGLVPAIAIVGIIGMYLAMVRMFRIDVFSLLLLALVIWRRADAKATLRAIADLFCESLIASRSGNIVVIAACATTIFFAAAFLVMTKIPYNSVDYTAFQLPLARSIVNHSGFVYPQIDSAFFSYNPLFYNLLFAEMMMFLDRVEAPSVLNIAIFFGFIAGLTTFYRNARAVGVLIGFLVIAYTSFFSSLVATPMGDIPRICFSVTGCLFAYRYVREERVYDITLAGLMFGAGIGSHYIELMPLAVVSIYLLPRLRYGRRAWRDAAVFVGTTTLVAGYWYARNWIVMGNPMWPLLFGHAGFTDAEMAAFTRDMTAGLVVNGYSFDSNLLTMAGWLDFARALYVCFLTLFPGAFAALLIVLGMAIARARVGVLLLWTAAMFLIWYPFMVQLRWAMSPFLLFCSTGAIAAAPLADKIVGWRRQLGDGSPVSVRRMRIAGLALTISFLIAAGLRLAMHGFALLPTWFDSGMAQALLSGIKTSDYLAAKLPGYVVYGYIEKHDLRSVLQPFDEEAVDRAARYDDGRRNDKRFLPYRLLPKSVDDVDQFVTRNNIKYFIDQPARAPDGKPFNAEQVAHVLAVLAALKQRAHLVVEGPSGWALYSLSEVAKSPGN